VEAPRRRRRRVLLRDRLGRRGRPGGLRSEVGGAAETARLLRAERPPVRPATRSRPPAAGLRASSTRLETPARLGDGQTSLRGGAGGCLSGVLEGRRKARQARGGREAAVGRANRGLLAEEAARVRRPQAPPTFPRSTGGDSFSKPGRARSNRAAPARDGLHRGSSPARRRQGDFRGRSRPRFGGMARTPASPPEAQGRGAPRRTRSGHVHRDPHASGFSISSGVGHHLRRKGGRGRGAGEAPGARLGTLGTVARRQHRAAAVGSPCA